MEKYRKLLHLAARTVRHHLKLTIAIGVGILIAVLWISFKPGNYLYANDGYRSVVGVSQENLGIVTQLSFKDDVESSAKKHEDINVLFMNAGGEADKQQKHILTLLEQGVDALIVCSENLELLEPSLEEVRNQKIPLILMGSNKSSEVCDVMVRMDYFRIGYAAGNYLKHNSDKGHINFLEIQGTPRTQKAKEIQKGFRAALENEQNISIPYIIAGADSFVTTQQRVSESGMMNAIPSVTGVFSHSDEMASGAAFLFRSHSQFPRIITISGSIGKTGGVSSVEKGIIEATVAVPSGGKETFRFAVDLIAHKNTPREYTLPISVVSAQNIDSYLRRLEGEE